MQLYFPAPRTHHCWLSSYPINVLLLMQLFRAFLWHSGIWNKCRHAACWHRGVVFTRININTASANSQRGGRLWQATSNCLAWEWQVGLLWPRSSHPRMGGKRQEVTVTRGCSQLSFKGFKMVWALGICRQCHLDSLSLPLPSKDQRM